MNPCKVNEVWDAKLKKCVSIKPKPLDNFKGPKEKPKPVPTFNGVKPKRVNLKKGGTVKSKKK
jgi:SH3-like domain-containing protein